MDPEIKPPGAEGVDKLLDDAEGSGKLAPLEKLIEDHGWSTSAKDLLAKAQLDDRTHGKTPEELASMLEADDSLYDDIEASGPGGAMEKGKAAFGRGEPEPEGDDVDPEDVDVAALAGPEGDNDKVKGAMKKAGVKKGGDMDKDFDKKFNFMRGMEA